jgi:hypothetical protein
MAIPVIITGLGRAFKNAKYAAVYAIVCILAFMVAYKLMGLEKHFDVPEYIPRKERSSWLNCLYTSALAQSNAMPDTTPKTRVARMLFMMQVVLGWDWFLILSTYYTT